MSTRDPTDIWAWTYEDRRRLASEGGGKATIAECWADFWEYYHNDYAAADHAIGLAIDAARREGELRWELLLRHWRLQLWLNGDIKRALPEAVDLLTLATDERVRDVPQRICAFHDVVDCHVRMDAAGYCADILANSQEVLAQVPKRHPCADCARYHAATASAEAGRPEDARRWLAEFAANLGTNNPAWGAETLADVYEALEAWEDAEREFVSTTQKARNQQEHLNGLLGTARARAARGNAAGALEALHEARHAAKYTGGPADTARLLAVEGYVAEACGEAPAAVTYLTRTAGQFLALARFRTAALTALHAADLAQRTQAPVPDEALEIAARAAGQMPPPSPDVVSRLAAFGRQPIAPSPAEQAQAADANFVPQDAAANERRSLEVTLESHVANGNLRGAALAVYRLGGWHASHKEPRAAVDYLIANAVLERLLELGMNDREDALTALQDLRSELPPNTVESALAAAESGPPAFIAPLLGELPLGRWQWMVRAIAAEVAGNQVVEPEPDAEEDSFGLWLDHTASMTALLLRFRDRNDADRRQRWAGVLEVMADEMSAQIGDQPQAANVVALVRALAALGRGVAPDEVRAAAPPSVVDLVRQIEESAAEPVWRQPGNFPLEFLVEHAAQRAVRGLRIHDDHRAERLDNLAWRFELMAIDLHDHPNLVPIGRFLDALAALMRNGGETAPMSDPPLEEPFTAVLAAVYEAGKSRDDPTE